MLTMHERACSRANSRDTTAASWRACSVWAASSAPPLPSGSPNRRALMFEEVGVRRDLTQRTSQACCEAGRGTKGSHRNSTHPAAEVKDQVGAVGLGVGVEDVAAGPLYRHLAIGPEESRLRLRLPRGLAASAGAASAHVRR